MIQITDIQWLNYESNEAEVLLFDGKFFVKCLAYPFLHQKGEEVKQPLFVFNTSNIMLEVSKCESIQYFENSYRHLIKGLLIDKSNKIVKSGEFIFELDYMLEYVEENAYISFIASRIDL
jgi:hypothetical protein